MVQNRRGGGHWAYKVDGSYPLCNRQVDLTCKCMEMAHQARHHFYQARIGIWASGRYDPVREAGVILRFLGHTVGMERPRHSWCEVGYHLAHVERKMVDRRAGLGSDFGLRDCGAADVASRKSESEWERWELQVLDTCTRPCVQELATRVDGYKGGHKRGHTAWGGNANEDG